MTEREAFEAWCKSKGAPKENWWVRQLDDGGYSCEPVDKAWEAWQARAQPAQAVPVLTSQDIWDDDHIMALNAELGLSMDQLVKLSHAIEQAVRAKMGAAGWQPISTAPRGSGEDGPSNVNDPAYIEPPHLLLWTKEGIRVGSYEWYYHPGYGRGADPSEPAWRDADGGPLYGSTHWMPLPPPPGIVGEKGGA